MASSPAPATDQTAAELGSPTRVRLEEPGLPISDYNDAIDASQPVLKGDLDNATGKLPEEQSTNQELYLDELEQSDDDDEDEDYTPSEGADEYSEYESGEDDEIATAIKESGEESESEYSEYSDEELYQVESEAAAYECRKMYEAEKAALAAKKDKQRRTESDVDLEELVKEVDEEIRRSEELDEEILASLPDPSTFGAYGQDFE